MQPIWVQRLSDFFSYLESVFTLRKELCPFIEIRSSFKRDESKASQRLDIIEMAGLDALYVIQCEVPAINDDKKNSSLSVALT